MMNNLQSSAFVAKTTQLLSSVARLRLLLVMFLTISVSAEVWGADITFTPSSDKGSVTTNGTTDGDQVTKSGFTITSSNGVMGNGSNYRVYTDGTLSITSTVGNITAISFTFSSDKYTGGLDNSYTGLSTTSWSASATSQARITNITITYTPTSATKHTVTLVPGSGSVTNTELEEPNAGEGVTLPTPTLTGCDEWTFAGWAEASVGTETTTKPTLIAAGTYKPASNITLYAVYQRTETTEGGGSGNYELVTSEPSDWSGTYLIVDGASENCFNGSLTTLDAGGNYETVTISNNTITSNTTTDSYSVTISKSTTDGKYYIETASGYYIGSDATDSSKGNELDASTTTKYDNSISISSNNVTIKGPDHILKFFYQSGQSWRFRFYKSTTTQNVRLPQLYKKSSGTTTTTYYYSTPSCSTETLVSLHPNGGTGGTPSVTATKGEAMPTLITLPTRTGYTFQGYFTAASGGTQYYNADGTSAKDWDKTDETFTLYAQWECAAPTNVKITGEYIRFEGDDIVLTVSGDNIATDATYEWKKGDQVINNQTTATLTINNCTISDAGNYTCTVSNGICSASNNYTVKMYRLRGLTDPEDNWTTDFVFAKGENKTATYSTTLNGNSSYQFKVHDGSVYYGNTGANPTMTSNNCTGWTMQESMGNNVTLQTTITGTYIFTLDYTDESNPTISVTYPQKKMVYLNPGPWDVDNAKFAVHTWEGDNGEDIFMKKVDDCDPNRNIYQAEINASHTNITFVRVNPAISDISQLWNSGILWNQTSDLILPIDGKVMYDMTPLFLSPTAWNSDGAWFAAYFYGNGETWRKMTDSDGNGIYECEKVFGYPNVIFCRMNPATTALSWDSKRNQSGNLTIPTKVNNHYTVPSDNAWEEPGDNGNWSNTGMWTTYTPNHTVSFDANGHGTAPEEQCIVEGGKATQPTPAPTATGYTFGGWYTDQACNNAWDFANDVVTSDITLYAKWTANTHTLTWDVNGGDALTGTYTSDSVAYGTVIIKPADPTRTDHKFMGWKETDGSTTVAETMPDKDLTYTAQWKFIPTLSWSASSCTAALEADNDYPDLTPNPADLTGITYSSSNTSVATIDPNTGVITLVSEGETTITASFAGNGTYAPAADASYELTVVESNCRWVETEIGDIQPEDEVVVVMTTNEGNTWALSNIPSTENPPGVLSVTVEYNALVGPINDVIKWNITNNDGDLIFYPNGKTDKWLYCINQNNGVRIGTNDNNIFTIDVTSGYLQHTATSRYVGVYSNQDWRCYTTVDGEIKNQTLKFYKRECLDPTEVWVEGNLTDVSCTPQLPQIIAKDGGSITLTFTAADGYALPTSVSVEMGSTPLAPSWNRTTGVLTINAPTGGFTDNVLVTIEALQVKTVTFSVDSEDTAPTEMQAEENTDIILPAFTTNLTCVKFVGWTDADNDAAITSSNIYKAGDTYTVTQDITLKAVYAAGGGFVLVTDANDLAAGDRIVIAAAGFDVAMGVDKGNNRGEVEVTKDNTDNTISTPDGIQILTLKAGTVTEDANSNPIITYAFNTGSGYLYAASSGSNHLKTQETKDANGSWTISIDSEGIATIKAQGSYTRNWLRYNSSSSIFSCYATGQSDVSIYKESITGYTTDPECVMYNVTLCTPTNGTISVDKTIVDPYGSTILTFAPVAGYMLDAVTITSGTAEVGTVSYTSNQTSDGTVKISNIQSDIEVCATFKEIPYYKVTFVDMNNGNAETIVHQSEFGGDITAPASASAGCDVTWTFIGWAPSNSLNGTTEVPANLVEAGGTISGANITNNNLIYYSVYSNSSDGTPPFSIGKSGTYYMYALDGSTKYYATTIYNSNTLRSNNTNFESYPKATFKLDFDSNNSKYKIKVTTNTSEAYLYQPDTYDKELILDDDDLSNYSLFTIINGSETESYRVTYSYYAQESKYVNGQWVTESVLKTGNFGMSSQKFAGRADGYDVYFEPASEMHYYNASDCTDDYVTMSFHNPFGSSKAQLQYEVGYEADYYTNTSKKYVDVFPTLEYAGWTFIGWTAGSSYNAAIGDENLNDENSSASAPTQDIYKTGGGLSYYLGGDVTMYPVFTKFEDNEPFDMVNGGDYYIYYIADGDIGTSVDEYGAAQRIYAAEYDDYGFRSTQSCADATLFTFTKLPDGKWTIYDNTRNKYVYGVNNDNKLEDRAQTGDGKEKFIKEWSIEVINGNQVNAVCAEGYVLSAYSQDATTGTFKNYDEGSFRNNTSLYHRVYVGTCTERVYSSNPSNKPAITLSGEPIVTSTQDQSIRARGELSISATKLAANGTITLTSDNADVYFSTVKDANFTQATKPVRPLPLEADEKGKLAMTTVYVHYKPTSTSSLGVQTANITATTGTNGQPDYATATTTAALRNLPTKFVIATKVGAIWYALPADLTTASNPLGVVIEVDETNMTATAPNSCTYTLFPVKTTNTEYDRYEEYGDRLRFSAVNNSYKGLWANNSKTDLTINNDMVIDQASDGQTGSDLANNSYYEWKVTTTVVDGHWQYTLQTDQTQNQNYLRYWTSAEGTPVGPKWGTYNAGENKLYFLPVTETQPFEYDVVEWYPTKMLIQTDAPITSPTVKVRGEEVASPELTSKGGKLYEISNLPLETNPNELLQVSFTTDAVNYVNAKVVPIILSRGAKSITGEPFATLTQKVYQYADVVVRDGATLTIDGGTDVANTLLGMTIYPTAKVSVAEGKKLSVHNLTFFGGIDEIYDGSAYTINKYGVPQLSLKGILNKTVTSMDYIMRVNLDQMYQMGVPYNVNLSDITYWDGTTMTLGDNLYISAYDGQARANRESKTWIWETDFAEKLGSATLKPGIGYTISADKQDAAHEYSIIRMPMTKNISSSYTEEEKKVNVVAYDNQKGVTITDNHKGWNYLSNPYMVAISGAEADSKLVVGYLRETGTGPWKWVVDNYRYVTIPSDDGKWYDQQKFKDATLLPFKSFFLQIATDGELSFALASRQSAPARYLQSSNEQREVEFEVLLANDTRSDNLGFLIGEDYTPAYEINADLEKMLGTMSVYTIYGGYNLAYNALSPTNAAEQIPIGYVVPTVGEYTFALDENSKVEDIEHIYLFDYETSAITDLVTNVYTFTALEQKSDTRFAINVALKSKDNAATGLDNMNTNGELPTKFIYQEKMYILHHGVIYDATGKRVITINK